MGSSDPDKSGEANVLSLHRAALYSLYSLRPADQYSAL